MHDVGPRGVEANERLGDRRHEIRRVDADELRAGPRRIGERPEHVEDRSSGQLPSDRRGMAHRRVVGLREEESETELIDRSGDLLRRKLEPEAECLEHVSCTRGRRGGTIAMLGDTGTRSRGDKSRCRRDIEGVGPVASRADDVDEVSPLGGHSDGSFTHGLCTAGDLIGGLALCAQRDEESSDLGRSRFARHDLLHRRTRLGHREVVPVEELAQCSLDHETTSDSWTI